MMDIYPVVSYTIHITTCLLMASLLLANLSKSHSPIHQKCEKGFSLFLLFNVVVDLVYILLQYCDIDLYVQGTVYPYFVAILSFGLTLTLMLTHFSVTLYKLRWPMALLYTFIVVSLLHPILFVQKNLYAMGAHSQLGAIQYCEYLNTRGHTIYLYFFYITGVAYILSCCYSLFTFLYRYHFWLKKHRLKGNKQPLWRLFAILFLPTFISYLLCIFGVSSDLHYYLDLPIWSVIAAALSISYIRSPEMYASIALESLSLQMEYASVMTLYRKGLKTLSPDENLHYREQEVVRQALAAWASREDCPYNDPELTISSLSSELGIPATVLLRYINYSMGLRFVDYIQSLKMLHVPAHRVEG